MFWVRRPRLGVGAGVRGASASGWAVTSAPASFPATGAAGRLDVLWGRPDLPGAASCVLS